MINIEMNNDKREPKVKEKKPNENAGFWFSSSVKIFDPNTNQVLVHKRGDV